MALGALEILNGVNGHAAPSVVQAKAAVTAVADHYPAELDVCPLDLLFSLSLTSMIFRPQN
jgi:hypothetical protein